MWDESLEFPARIPTVLTQPKKWTGAQVDLPNIFADFSKGPKLALTAAAGGVLKQRMSYNLAEITNFLTKNYSFGKFKNCLALYLSPNWKLLTKEDAREEIYVLIAKADKRVADHLDSQNLDEIRNRILRSREIIRCSYFPHHDPHMLCCRDKLYLWPEDSIAEPCKENLCISYIDVWASEIRPCATPYFDRFLSTIAGDDDDLVTLILEVIGVISTGYPVKNFFVFEGVPNSGKSQIARFLENIVGETSYFAVSGINQLAGD